MTDIRCGFNGDRGETLIGYLYDDIDPAARAAFEVHLAGCQPCRAELDALGGVRSTLARWNPPEPKLLTAASADPQSAILNPQSQWWRSIPAWAQVAAALLVLGVSAGIANLEVRYDSNGFVVRTGWSKTQASPGAQATVTRQPESGQAVGSASKADLVALERQLRGEFRPMAAAAMPAAARPASSDAEILRKVRALVDEAERRQQRELALRLAQAISEVNAARQADLRRVDLTLNRVENNLGVEVLKNRQSMQYFMRANQRQ
jgi:hypothetical protein